MLNLKLKNMKTLKITDKNMTVKSSIELVENVIFREVNKTDNYDLIITEYNIDGFWKSTGKKLGEIELEGNDCWLNKNNVLVNQNGFITTIK